MRRYSLEVLINDDNTGELIEEISIMYADAQEKYDGIVEVVADIIAASDEWVERIDKLRRTKPRFGEVFYASGIELENPPEEEDKEQEEETEETEPAEPGEGEIVVDRFRLLKESHLQGKDPKNIILFRLYQKGNGKYFFDIVMSDGKVYSVESSREDISTNKEENEKMIKNIIGLFEEK